MEIDGHSVMDFIDYIDTWTAVYLRNPALMHALIERRKPARILVVDDMILRVDHAS